MVFPSSSGQQENQYYSAAIIMPGINNLKKITSESQQVWLVKITFGTDQ
jgi:hypothetical protein